MVDISTQLIHHPYQPPEGYAAPQPGVFKASTILFPSVAAMRERYADEVGHQYTYGTKGTPTTYLLEERLCTLEGGLYCTLVPSGLAAITLVNFAFLKTGDEVLIPDNVYGPSKTLADGELAHFGIGYQLYDAMNPADLAAKISAKTRLVWLEAPGSVTMEFPNLPELVRICKARKVLTALDNTWGAGLAFKPFDLGVDVSIHALTKYPSGGGDVLMGSVMVRDAALHGLIKHCHMRLGFSVGLNDVEAVLRSLPSMALRYRAHDTAARELARWCSRRPEVIQVLHPAIAGSPGHAHWRSLCGAGKDKDANAGHAAGLFSVMLHERYGSAQIDAFCDALKVFKIGFSWGGPMSLVVPYRVRSMRGLLGQPAARPAHMAHLERGSLVRFSVGLESADDLRADLAQAMQVALR
ncbi:MAG: PLP-dependent transferase [Burkholderiaceae bacterium]|nr:PLP-dependent transferase [Burkholderiaceae bacterium]